MIVPITMQGAMTNKNLSSTKPVLNCRFLMSFVCLRSLLWIITLPIKHETFDLQRRCAKVEQQASPETGGSKIIQNLRLIDAC